jgi:group I intron endonuclease
MTDYSTCVVYAIVCRNDNVKNMYVGSTVDLDKRKREHKSLCYNKNFSSYNLKVYKFIRENDGFDNFEFEILEEVCCQNKQQLLEREKFYIECLEPTLNSEVPSRTHKQWREDNPEYHKKYREEHRKKIHQKFICECGGRYTYSGKSSHLKTKKHQNYINNLVKIN